MTLQSIKERLDLALAKVQGEVGRFLILKERIMVLPAEQRAGLLATQESLEKEATDLVSRAGELKASLPAELNPLDFAMMRKVPELTQRVATMARDLGKLTFRIAEHTQRVEQAEGGSVRAVAREGGSITPFWVAAGVLAGVWLLRRK